MLHPLTVHLTYSLGLALQEYFQLGGRDEAAEDAETEGETEAAVRGGLEDTGGWRTKENLLGLFHPLPTHPHLPHSPLPPAVRQGVHKLVPPARRINRQRRECIRRCCTARRQDVHTAAPVVEAGCQQRSAFRLVTPVC